MPLTGQIAATEEAVEHHAVAHDNLIGDLPSRPEAVPGEGGRERHVEDERDGRQPAGGGATDHRSAGLALEVRRVDHAEQPEMDSLSQRSVQESEGTPGRRLVRLVAGDQSAEGIGREDLVAGEQPSRQRRLAGAGRAHEEHDRRVRELDDELRLALHARRDPRCRASRRYDARRASQPPVSPRRTS